MEASSVIELPGRLIGPAAEMLVRALFDDPQTIYFEPDQSRRAAHITPVFRFLISYGLRFGLVEAASERLEGLACWLPPGGMEMTRWRLVRSGALGLPRRVGREVMGRLRQAQRHGGEIHRRVAPGPHWYLTVIGVEPGLMGRGVGSRLIEAGLSRLDEGGLPCFLETHQERNIDFYRRFGFEVAEVSVLPDSDVRHFALIRQPRG